MSPSRILTVCVVVASVAAAAGSPVMAGRIANGDFEAVTAGVFDSWTCSPGPEVASASAAPTVVGGNYSARLAAGGGLLSQTVSTDGIRHFAIEMDFAVLDTASTDVRSLGVVTYSTAGGSHSGSDNIDSIRVYTTAANRHEIQVYDKGGFQNTGLFVKATPDIYGDLRFDDGETPVVNHLKIVGAGYGTAGQAVTITVTRGETSGSYTRRLCYVGTNSAVKEVGLYSAGSSADYLVDNLSFEPQPAPPPEPDLVEKALELMSGAEEIVFAERALYSDGHYYANFGGWSDDPNKFLYPPDGSRLCKLNLRTKQLTVLLDDPRGNIRDPRVHYDGGKILFAYRKGGTRHYNLYEINTDAGGLRQLTFGEWDDTDPAYLPDGGIVFVSSRARRFIPCNHVRAAILYRMDADGGNIVCLSANNVRDDRPAVLPDGRVIYTRWEYVDSAIGSFRDLWVMNPDGTGQMILFGGTVRPPNLVFSKCDALPIPGTDGKVVSVFSPPVGLRENAGNVTVVDIKAGPDEAAAARQISPKRDLRYHYFWPSGIPWFGGGRTGFRDPYPLSEDCFLVAEDKSLLVLDGNETVQEFYRADKMVHDPRVIRQRPRERVVPPFSDLKRSTGRLVLANIYRGRNMKAVKPGTIKKLLVLEDLPKPISYFSLPGLISMDGTHTLRRVLGTVPVEPDGSASFEVPPLRGLYFVALDEKGLAVKRMQSYTMVMPGETQGCVGCHEPRTEPPSSAGSDVLMASRRPPSRIKPIPGVPDVFDYPRDIQPIWDRHCVTCHSAEKPEGRVVLTGDYNEWFTQSYYALFAYSQISDMVGRYNTEFRNHQPYGFGTGASPLMNKIDGSHYEVKLTKPEHATVRLWIEASAYFTGTYAVYNHSENAVAGALANSAKVEIGKPLDGIVYNRCLWCHDSAASMGRRVRKGRMNAPKHCWNLYNLSYPEKSMILLAPLAKEAGGYGWCKDQYGQTVVFRDTQDPDYRSILQAIRAAKTRQEKAGRYDMTGFRPNEHYVRWMKRFGVLPQNIDLTKDPINPYETDKAYWRSLWHQPSIAGAASVTGEMGE